MWGMQAHEGGSIVNCEAVESTEPVSIAGRGPPVATSVKRLHSTLAYTGSNRLPGIQVAPEAVDGSLTVL